MADLGSLFVYFLTVDHPNYSSATRRAACCMEARPSPWPDSHKYEFSRILASVPMPLKDMLVLSLGAG